jgi:hypothetical protein
MAHTWKYAFALGLVGTALTVGCVVKEGDGDGVGGAAGEAGSGGTGGSGGSSGKGGNAGKGGSAGTGGSAGKGGNAGTGGSSAGTGGTSAGTGGASGEAGGGTGGSGGAPIVVECEDLEGTTPWPNCEAEDSSDECGTCIEANCCEESMACYSTDPYNACGWGGPSSGDYSGAGEIGCYLVCLEEYVAANDGICDDMGIDQCTSMCTDDCSLVPDATNEMVACVNANCAQDCFKADAETCGD